MAAGVVAVVTTLSLSSCTSSEHDTTGTPESNSATSAGALAGSLPQAPGSAAGEAGRRSESTKAAESVDPDSLSDRFPDLGALTTTIRATNESQACNEAQSRIFAYRDMASEASNADLPILQDSLEEFEQVLYTAADEQDWGDTIIEYLTNTRRLWATASSAADDSKQFRTSMDQASGFLDRALAIECPA